MNLLLLNDSDFTEKTTAIISDYRFQHLTKIKKVQLSDSLAAGKINGLMGNASVRSISKTSITFDVTLDTSPPKALPATLIIALPRPKMLKRILQTAATMGVKDITFINSYRTEKSYWQSPLLKAEKIHEQLLAGLEQGIDTILPNVHLIKLFKPFVEDVLPELCAGKRALVAHPDSLSTCPEPTHDDTVLVIGPEGGFTPYEICKLNEAGCKSIHLGDRILRVETAVPVLLAKLFSL
jgi:RsmE family RNA methyltransferase